MIFFQLVGTGLLPGRLCRDILTRGFLRFAGFGLSLFVVDFGGEFGRRIFFQLAGTGFLPGCLCRGFLIRGVLRLIGFGLCLCAVDSCGCQDEKKATKD